MSILYNETLIGSSAAGAYEIDQSLRFDGSSHLLWTPSSTGNSVRKWTISVWVKQNYATGSTARYMISAGPNIGSDTAIYPYTYDLSGLGGRYYFVQGDGTRYVRSVDRFRDESAWYHFVFQSDADNATTGDKLKIFVNGQRITTESPESAPSTQNTYWNSTNQHRIARIGTTTNWTGYMAEFHSVDNQLVAPDQFGETDLTTGAWIPKEYTGSYGTNGFYLKFDPTATNGIGHDHSGNGNNWTASGFTTSGTGTDVMSDTPTTNWCTLNPLQQSNDTTLSDGNLRFAGSVSKGMICGTQGATSGKYYWEFIVDDSGQDMAVGITNLDETVLNLGSGGSVPGRNTWSWGLYMYPLNSYIRKVHNTVYTDTSATKVSNGDVIGIAYDAGAGKMWASKNNTWMDSGDPTAGTNALFTNLTGTLAPAVNPPGGGVSTTNTANFGQRAFAYTPPTGFKALNTSNLPEPTIKDGSKYFDTLIWTGDSSGANRTFSGLAFGPDLVWAKGRNQALSHQLTDIVRGAGGSKSLRSDTTNAEGADGTGNGYISAFTSDGFETTSSSTNVYYNTNTYTYAAWCWDAGGAGSSNNAGSITSTVSANASAGFSIVTFTGNGSTATVGHGLGVAPRFVIVRKRSGGTMGAGYSDWCVYSQALVESSGQSDAFLYLNSTAAKSNSSSVFGSAPTSTVFSIGNNQLINNSGSLFVAYCFSEVAGYSKFGSFSGGDGVFVYLGFRPAFIMVKDSQAAYNWTMLDSTRNTYNQVNSVIHPHLANAESNQDSLAVDFLSNGFKVRGGNHSVAGNTVIYAAFAELPFKYANAR